MQGEPGGGDSCASVKPFTSSRCGAVLPWDSQRVLPPCAHAPEPKKLGKPYKPFAPSPPQEKWNEIEVLWHELGCGAGGIRCHCVAKRRRRRVAECGIRAQGRPTRMYGSSRPSRQTTAMGS